MNACGHRSERPARAPSDRKRRTTIMAALIGLVLIVLVAIAIFGMALHVLFSPWLLLVAVGIVAWIKFRPDRSHR
jgi:uncharacterized membrane protein